MAKKRITELATETTLKDGQYIPIDHSTDGTKKYNLGGKLIELEDHYDEELSDLKEDLQDETTARENADTKMASEISDLFEMGTLSAYNNDKTPYLFRASGGGKYIGGIEKDTIVGGTVAWNQLCNGSSVTVPNGHKYYMVKGGTASIGESTGTAITGLTSGTDIVSDLTQMFGSTIADHIYSLERATAGSGVAKLKEWGFFSKDYYPYDVGGLKSVEGLQSHDMVGFNQWDEEWENGYYDSTAGAKVASANCIRSKNKIPVIPGATYFHNLTVSYLRRQNWDINGSFISQQSVASFREFTIPDNAHYITFYCDDSYGKVYNHDICINLSDPSRNGTYEPYQKHSYPLDSSVILRGIPKQDDNGDLYYDGDRYLPDGTVERRFNEKVYDGSSDENWQLQSINSHGIANFYTYVTYQSSNDSGICNRFVQQDTAIADTTTEGFILSGGDTLYIRISSSKASTVEELRTWLASNTVQLIHFLATPTTEQADPYQTPQLVDKDGTEEYVTTGIVPVGHDTEYYLDADSVLTPPSTAGTYSLKVTVASDGSKSYSWVSD